jgi:hypothetical protein
MDIVRVHLSRAAIRRWRWRRRKDNLRPLSKKLFQVFVARNLRRATLIVVFCFLVILQ